MPMILKTPSWRAFFFGGGLPNVFFYYPRAHSPSLHQLSRHQRFNFDSLETSQATDLHSPALSSSSTLVFSPTFNPRPSLVKSIQLPSIYNLWSIPFFNETMTVLFDPTTGTVTSMDTVTSKTCHSVDQTPTTHQLSNSSHFFEAIKSVIRTTVAFLKVTVAGVTDFIAVKVGAVRDLVAVAVNRLHNLVFGVIHSPNTLTIVNASTFDIAPPHEAAISHNTLSLILRPLRKFLAVTLFKPRTTSSRLAALESRIAVQDATITALTISLVQTRASITYVGEKMALQLAQHDHLVKTLTIDTDVLRTDVDFEKERIIHINDHIAALTRTINETFETAFRRLDTCDYRAQLVINTMEQLITGNVGMAGNGGGDVGSGGQGLGEGGV